MRFWVARNERQTKHRHSSHVYQAQLQPFTADCSGMGSPRAADLNRKICFSVGSSTGFRPVRKSFASGSVLWRQLESAVCSGRAAPCLCSQRPPCSTPSPLRCQHLATYSQYSAHWEYLLGSAPGWTCEWARQQRDWDGENPEMVKLIGQVFARVAPALSSSPPADSWRCPLAAGKLGLSCLTGREKHLCPQDPQFLVGGGLAAAADPRVCLGEGPFGSAGS